MGGVIGHPVVEGIAAINAFDIAPPDGIAEIMDRQQAGCRQFVGKPALLEIGCHPETRPFLRLRGKSHEPG
ncbi:hypothetical protein [Aliiruegeria lutimaris]|uniref:hypothetical protein n=1 Tax=Aliiruegeria lutimaris TaxID=571298 RepID=UPI001113BF57|nr:hypothetical protein [Aliiruegeria lutimaris]